jgi:hypothetical protein
MTTFIVIIMTTFIVIIMTTFIVIMTVKVISHLERLGESFALLRTKAAIAQVEQGDTARLSTQSNAS